MDKFGNLGNLLGLDHVYIVYIYNYIYIHIFFASLSLDIVTAEYPVICPLLFPYLVTSGITHGQLDNLYLVR